MLTLDDLKSRYGKNAKRKQLFNRSVRAECPGGEIVLDTLELMGNIRLRKLDEGDTESADIAGQAEQALHLIRDEMVESIQQRYGLGK